MTTAKDFDKLSKKLKLNFKNPELLQQALVHRSYINENRNFTLDHNERLEFLGDAVLELVVTEYLYLNFPNPEGDLTNWRASLVNSKMLSELAKELNLENYLYLSKGESQDANPKARNYILANAVEALIGAIYLDAGYPASKKFVAKYLLVKLKYILEHHLYLDPKSKLQEIIQDRFSVTPTYRVIAESGPDHQKKFKVGVYLEDRQLATGLGLSKREAQEKAAAKALTIPDWQEP